MKKCRRAIRMLLERIDGELAEIRDGLIEIDHKTAVLRQLSDIRLAEAIMSNRLLAERVRELEIAYDRGETP